MIKDHKSVFGFSQKDKVKKMKLIPENKGG